MSSRKRRKAREWMSRVVETHRAELLKRNADCNALVQRERADIKRDLTRMIPREELGDEKFIYPTGVLKDPYIILGARYDLDPIRQVGMAHMQRWPERFHLRAEQHGLPLPDGTCVVWWSWRMQ